MGANKPIEDIEETACRHEVGFGRARLVGPRDDGSEGR